ncbi:hypothetical protein B0H13DRAFT_1894345 [Mycena leptocephala]|nr:hypothetical protein B0H13DRAFT_1894345 [Mycena leptocephala]
MSRVSNKGKLKTYLGTKPDWQLLLQLQGTCGEIRRSSFTAPSRAVSYYTLSIYWRHGSAVELILTSKFEVWSAQAYIHQVQVQVQVQVPTSLQPSRKFLLSVHKGVQYAIKHPNCTEDITIYARTFSLAGKHPELRTDGTVIKAVLDPRLSIFFALHQVIDF